MTGNWKKSHKRTNTCELIKENCFSVVVRLSSSFRFPHTPHLKLPRRRKNSCQQIFGGGKLVNFISYFLTFFLFFFGLASNKFSLMTAKGKKRDSKLSTIILLAWCRKLSCAPCWMRFRLTNDCEERKNKLGTHRKLLFAPPPTLLSFRFLKAFFSLFRHSKFFPLLVANFHPER